MSILKNAYSPFAIWISCCHERAVERMRKWTVTDVMAQSCYADAKSISTINFIGKASAELLHELHSQVISAIIGIKTYMIKKVYPRE
jgi:hypothetical protein